LSALVSIFEASKSEEKISFNSAQLEMLNRSEEEIKYGCLYSEEDIEKLDSKWMN
jgi:hypothetical protein